MPNGNVLPEPPPFFGFYKQKRYGFPYSLDETVSEHPKLPAFDVWKQSLDTLLSDGQSIHPFLKVGKLHSNRKGWIASSCLLARSQTFLARTETAMK